MKILLAIPIALALAACAPSQPDAPSASAAASATAEAPHPTSTTATASSAPAPAPAPMPASASTVDDIAAVLKQDHWQLTEATDASGQRIEELLARSDRPLQLDFDARSVSVTNACNRMHGAYTLAGGEITFTTLASTMMACADPKLTALDAAVGKYLAGTLSIALDPGGDHPRLTLSTAQRDTLVFAGEPTADTRYGTKPETVFLEVAPQARPCNSPVAKDAQCLEVRELHYDTNGLRNGPPGAWETLGQPIEGYTHTPGIRNVLRVKRYAIANPPADGSSVAYVLDLVVESGTTPH